MTARISEDNVKAWSGDHCVDPDTGRPVVEAVERPNREISKFAPDLVIGYAPGYRASWQSALGAVQNSALDDNL